MSDETGTLRLALRGHVLATDAAVRTQDGLVFVGLERPPPVRSMLDAHDGRTGRVLEVVRVVESGAERGFVGRWLERAPERTGKVGTEHLAPGDPADPALASAVGRPDSGPESAASYPIPAPVLEPEPSSTIDLVARQMIEADEDGEGEVEEGEEGDGPNGKPRPRGKKRKGRKRG